MNTMADSIGEARNDDGAASFQPVSGPQLHGLLDGLLQSPQHADPGGTAREGITEVDRYSQQDARKGPQPYCPGQDGCKGDQALKEAPGL